METSYGDSLRRKLFLRQFGQKSSGNVGKREEEDHLLDEKEQGRFARMRKLNALRAEMKKAVRHEEFERAAQLRDEIRALENTKESA